MPTEIREANEQDLDEILNLQADSHADRVPPEERTDQGFVSLRTSREFLRDALQELGIIVAEKNGWFAGYCIAATWERAEADLLLHLITQATEKTEPTEVHWNDHWAVLAQIAVRKEFKRQGISGQILRGFLSMLEKRGIQHVATEVSPQNPGSLRAHAAAGFQELSRIQGDDGREWVLIARSTKD